MPVFILGQIHTFSGNSRIGCVIATTHQVLDNNGFVTRCLRLFNIDRDITSNTASRIVTTIHILKNTTGDGQGDITRYMGIIRPAMYEFYLFGCTTRYNRVDITSHIGLVAGTINSGNL